MDGHRYLSTLSLSAYGQLMARRFPAFSRLLWLDRPGFDRVLSQMNEGSTEFERRSRGGRGDEYRAAQRDPLVRQVGIRQLLDHATRSERFAHAPAAAFVLDVLGGDGTLARASRQIARRTPAPRILTGDIAEDMVAQALRYGIPAVRQPAQFLLIHDASVDAAILAYGTHHIPIDERVSACTEAHRVLKPSGRVVLHDFAETSPVASWFREVVDRFSITGHKHPHFTESAMASLLLGCGFVDVEVTEMYDPLIVSGSDPQDAHDRLMEYVINMYGLELLTGPAGSPRANYDRVSTLLGDHFRYCDGNRPSGVETLTVSERGGRFVAELPRVALVAVGTRPARP